MIAAAACLLPTVAVTRESASPSVPYYETSRLVLTLNGGPWSAEAIRRTLAASLAEQGLAGVVRAGPGGAPLPAAAQPESTDSLDGVEALACLTVVSFGVRGAEVDLVLTDPDAPGARVPVSVWWEGTSMRVARARAPWVSGGHPPTGTADRPALRALGVPLVDRDARWDDRGVHRVRLAAERLSARERPVLQGLVFERRTAIAREARPPPGLAFASVSAAFVGGDGPLRVEVYDAALDERDRFVGPVDDPLVVGAFDILHELGHALARYDLRQIDEERAVLIARLRTQQERIRRVRRRGGRDLDQAIADNNTTVQHLQALDAQIVGRGESPATKVMRGLLAGQLAPTPYGRTDPDEAFADAFALFHADPAALRRASPSLHAWFLAGGHLDAVGL